MTVGVAKLGCRCLRGSILPKALYWALPCTGLVYLYRYIFEVTEALKDPTYQYPSPSESMGFSLFTSILGFLLVFRAQLAYNRFWEGITLVERSVAVWLNGVSNLVAFCNAAEEKQVEVATFQHLLSRLMSLLLHVSLCDIALRNELHFPTLNVDGVDPESLDYLYTTESKQKVVMQWVQRLVVENHRSGAIDIAPPILSRVFQEFSLGVVKFIDAKKISRVPFPFVFAQILWIMLSFFSVILVPISMAMYLPGFKAYIVTFVTVCIFVALQYTAIEIEHPFDEGPNCLPLEDINDEFNDSLRTLLQSEAQQTPVLVKTTSEMIEHVAVCKRMAHQRTSATGMDFSASSNSSNLIEKTMSLKSKIFGKRLYRNSLWSGGTGSGPLTAPLARNSQERAKQLTPSPPPPPRGRSPMAAGGRRLQAPLRFLRGTSPGSNASSSPVPNLACGEHEERAASKDSSNLGPEVGHVQTMGSIDEEGPVHSEAPAKALTMMKGKRSRSPRKLDLPGTDIEQALASTPLEAPGVDRSPRSTERSPWARLGACAAGRILGPEAAAKAAGKSPAAAAAAEHGDAEHSLNYFDYNDDGDELAV